MRGTSIYQRGSRVVTAFVVAFASVTAFLPFFLTQNVSAATSEINTLAFGATTEQTIYENQVSGALYLVTRDSNDELEPLDNPGATLTLHVPSGGQLFTDTTNPSGGNTLTLDWASGSSQSPAFYYKNSQDGTYLLTATLNTGQAPPQLFTTSQNIYVIPDTTPPGIPVNGSPNGSQTNTDPVAFNWQAPSDNLSASDALLYDFRFSQNSDIDGNGMLTTGTTREKLTSENNSESGLNNNTTYFWQVRAYDEANNASTWSTVWGFGIDRTPPTVTLDSAANGTAFGGNKSDVVSTGTVSDAHIKSYIFTVTGDTGFSTSSNELAAANGAVSFTWGVANEPSGSHTYTVTLTAIDSANNQTTTPSQQVTLTIDNTAPDLSVSNDGFSYTGGSVQPQVISDDPQDTSYEWFADEDNPAELNFDESAEQPIFRPTTAGTYTFYVRGYDAFNNYSLLSRFRFTWEPSVVPVADTAIANAVVADTMPPAGLVATKFNTTSPTTLGLTSENSAQVSSTTAPVKDEPRAKQNNIQTTYTDDSSTRMWWVLLALAIGAAGYYAYRNWQLTQPKD